MKYLKQIKKLFQVLYLSININTALKQIYSYDLSPEQKQYQFEHILNRSVH